MNLPEIGHLRHRVRIQREYKVPGEGATATRKVTEEKEIWGALEVVGSGIYWDSKEIEETVSHRIIVRTIKGVTRPQDLKGVRFFIVGGIRYQARRIADLGGEGRFTVIDCDEKGLEDAT